MPVKPQFEWEQTPEHVFLHITIKGCKKNAVDVFIADVFAKINAPPQYLLSLDLLHAVDADKSSHYFDPEDNSLLHVKLHKVEAGLVWGALCTAMPKKELMKRRAESMKKAEKRYNEKLEARAKQAEAERRRMTEAQWEVEKQQRSHIEDRFNQEKNAAESDLYRWEETQPAAQKPKSPGDILASYAAQQEHATNDNNNSSSESEVPIRDSDTVNVTIDFTPKMFAMPTRSRGDEEYYRQSRYKPVSVEDSPMFWKDRGDTYYKEHNWKAAADSYSESIKRDGVFLTCVMNRAACFMHMADYKKAIEDSTLALTMLANTPASEITQERYRIVMTKLHARRGAAYCWSGDLQHGVQDLRMASAYRDPTDDEDVAADLAVVEAIVSERGIEDDRDPAAEKMQKASALYYQNKYDEAIAMYQEVLEENPYAVSCRSNLTAALLQVGRFNEALTECNELIRFCGEVAEALNQPGALSGGLADSDDDDEMENDDSEAVEGGYANADDANNNRDTMAQKRRAAAKKVSENSGHVYLLLKAYVRGAAALSGMKEYRKAHSFLEQALRITPYDNDLLDDCNRLTEKVRMETLVAASAQSCR